MINIIIIWTINLVLLFSLFLMRKKQKVFPLIFLTFFITLFSLFTPNGKILFSIWNYNFTQGAIFDGLFKSGILILIQLLSKIIIFSKIKFPGKIGSFINDVFVIYNNLLTLNKKDNTQIKNSKTKFFQKINFDNLISSIDKKLFEIYDI